MYSNRIRNIELPENLFSNLGEIKSRKIETEKNNNLINTFTDDYLSPQENNKLTTYSNKEEYRERITKMYEGLKNIKPIDNKIDDIIYWDNYQEKGIVVKPKVSSLKQFWTEYRLIRNEKVTPHETNTINKLPEADNFDALFDALSIRVKEINSYIDELKEMRNSMNIESRELRADKENFSKEKKRFQEFKKSEESKIKEDKENLKINFEKLQTIIDDLDKKLGSIDK